MIVLAFEEDRALAEPLAGLLRRPLAWVDVHRFPDGESRLRLPCPLPERVCVLRSLHEPNAKLTELLLAAGGARELGARHLTLLAPYLGYMRQDAAFSPGEVVSQRHIGRLLAAAFDAVVTVDPHLHRVASLAEVVPGGAGLALTAAPLLGRHIAAALPGATLVAPDEEAGQWVRAAAAAAAMPHAMCRKNRRGDRDVSVRFDGDLHGRDVVLLDDVASTGRTLIAAGQAALAAGARSVHAAVTHALFVGDALQAVRAAGITQVWSSDSIPHATNAVSLAPMLAAALQELDSGR
jgi:ribose-phosphate pyrophosphokinase